MRRFATQLAAPHRNATIDLMPRRHAALPPTLAPRGLSRIEAAAYLGIGATLFDELVGDRRLPGPKLLNTRRVWDRHALDSAFAALPDEDGGGNPWNEIAA